MLIVLCLFRIVFLKKNPSNTNLEIYIRFAFRAEFLRGGNKTH